MSESPPSKKPKRTYRACYPCRVRKLKCNFGDPNQPWDGPCQRCLRESRECIKGQPVPLHSQSQPVASRSTLTSADTPVDYDLGPSWAPSPRRQTNIGPSSLPGQEDELLSEWTREPTAAWDPKIDQTLVSARLHNPQDAINILATASEAHAQRNLIEGPPRDVRDNLTWTDWAPVKLGFVRSEEANALFNFYETEMNPLYPVLCPGVFDRSYLPRMIRDESLLLGATVAIASRYSPILYEDRAKQVHLALSVWIRQRLLQLLDGMIRLRSSSTVEALLILSEWPLVSLPDDGPAEDEQEENPLEACFRHDAYSWNHIGWAVRLAQDIGLANVVFNNLLTEDRLPEDWIAERYLRTWVFAYNADRHVSLRLGRLAVLQSYMPSRWWERISVIANRSSTTEKGTRPLWIHDVYGQASIACLLGTVQEYLYPSKEVTQQLLRSGLWEQFLRSFRLEIAYVKQMCQRNMGHADSVSVALLRIEMDYMVLYAEGVALRALQERLRRRLEIHQLHFSSPFLLNYVEGAYIMEALAAARSILSLTVTVLDAKNVLRYCPSRIYQRIIFAATFLYKALAIGVVEHGRSTVLDAIESAVKAILRAPLDDQHFVRGFGTLLLELRARLKKDVQTPQPDPVPSSHSLDPTPQVFETILNPALASNPAATTDLFAAPSGADDIHWRLDPSSLSSQDGVDSDDLFQTLLNGSAGCFGAVDEPPPTENLFGTILGGFADVGP